MKEKELYVFNGISRAAVYGIGTYMDQLLKVLKDSEWKLTVIYLYARGNEIEIIEKNGHRQINIPFPAANNPRTNQYYDKIIVYLLKDIIQSDNKKDFVFHVNFMNNYHLVNYLKKHFLCKIILTVHYTDWSFSLLGDVHKLRKLLKKPEKDLKNLKEKAIVKGFREDVKMINKVDSLICVAQHTWNIFHKLGAIPEGKTEIINNALEDIYKPISVEKKIELRTKYYLEEDPRIILFAGRLDDVKGISGLIKAFRKILNIIPDTYLIIAGDGNFNTWMKESGDSWSRILFTGRLEKKRLFELFQIADIGIVCSLHEEFGFVAIEMMMYSLPIIVTKAGGLDEIVEDGVSGLKIPVRTLKGKREVDVKQLAEKMRLLLNNPAYAQVLGQNGRKRFLEKYELKVFKEKMLNLYNNL